MCWGLEDKEARFTIGKGDLLYNSIRSANQTCLTLWRITTERDKERRMLK